MSKLWSLSHCDLSNFNQRMIIIPCKYLVSGTCVILYKMALHKPRYLNLRVLTSLRYLLYSSCRSLASFSLISSTGRPRWVMKPIRLSGRVFSCFLNRSASCFYNTNNKVQTCACCYDKCGRKNEIWWLVLFISLRLKAFNLFNKHMHGVYIAWLLS